MGVPPLPKLNKRKTEIAAMCYACINKTECINELNHNSSPSNTKACSCPSERITNGKRKSRKKIENRKKLKGKKI